MDAKDEEQVESKQDKAEVEQQLAIAWLTKLPTWNFQLAVIDAIFCTYNNAMYMTYLEEGYVMMVSSRKRKDIMWLMYVIADRKYPLLLSH